MTKNNINDSAFSPDDPRVLHVSPHADPDGDGSSDSPFDTIAGALVSAQPGSVILLGPGTYEGDLTIEFSGTYDKPLRIVSGKINEAVVSRSCWYLYDVSDIIISGLAFHDSPLGSIAVMGACERNRFEKISFVNCSSANKASSTIFFGGSGGANTIVEQCVFERQAHDFVDKPNLDNLVVGLMISEGDRHQGKPIHNFLIRNNRFVNYDYGILVGTDDETMNLYGHRIEANTIDHCAFEGIMVKCGDTQVSDNLLLYCKQNAVSVVTGQGTVVENNRIVNCGCGIRVAGQGHTVSNNCIIRSSGEAMRIMSHGASVKESVRCQTKNILIEANTLVGWSMQSPAIAIEPECSAIVRKNLLYNSDSKLPAAIDVPTTETAKKKPALFIDDNLDALAQKVLFVNMAGDDFTNESGYGARGWMTSPDPFVVTDDVPVVLPHYDDSSFDEEESDDPASSQMDVIDKSMFIDERADCEDDGAMYHDEDEQV